MAPHKYHSTESCIAHFYTRSPKCMGRLGIVVHMPTLESTGA